MKLTDYVLTPEGQEFRSQLAEKLMEIDPWGKIRSGPMYNQLTTLNALEGYFYREEYPIYLKTLPVLEEKGFITKATEISADRILESIQNPEIKKDLDIYHRIARGEGEVSNREIDYLFNKCKKEIGESAKDRPYGGAINTVRKIVRLLESAETRSEKILAIDATMSLMHDQGGVATFGFWNIDWELDPDAETSTKFLTRLFEE